MTRLERAEHIRGREAPFQIDELRPYGTWSAVPVADGSRRQMTWSAVSAAGVLCADMPLSGLRLRLGPTKSVPLDWSPPLHAATLTRLVACGGCSYTYMLKRLALGCVGRLLVYVHAQRSLPAVRIRTCPTLPRLVACGGCSYTYMLDPSALGCVWRLFVYVHARRLRAGLRVAVVRIRTCSTLPRWACGSCW
jgi:hypothetical protein